MSATPTLSSATVATYARHLVEKAGVGPRVLALRAAPTWDGPATLDIDGEQVAVRACASSLAVRECLLDADGGFLVLLTDREADDLGESLTSRFLHQRVQMVDPWRAVAELFAANAVSPELKATGTVMAEALADHRPTGGYPAAATGVVTADHAFAALLTAVTRERTLDPMTLLAASTDLESKARWLQLPAEVRAQLMAWTRNGLGLVSELVLQAMSSPTQVDSVTVGLAADVLYRDPAPAGAIRAQGRLEIYLNGVSLDGASARAFADAALAFTRSLPPESSLRAQLVSRAAAFLADLGWPQAAELSDVLPQGYVARLQAVGVALAGQRRDVEGALRALAGHDLAATAQAAATRQAEMAVRLHRWLRARESEPPRTLAQALVRQLDEDAWVDWAIAEVFVGSSDAAVGEAYHRLVTQARERRGEHDRQFAQLLAEGGVGAGSSGTAGTPSAAGASDGVAGRATGAADGVDVLFIEDVIAHVVAPLAACTPVLLVVVDGMSGAVAAELVADAERLGWAEFVAGDGRLPVVAVLPTITRYSRTSLFCGTLTDGGAADEKRAFDTLLSARLFHKDDLRSSAGYALPEPVRTAMSSADRVVGVVLNTVDDALAKADPGGTSWTIAGVQHLRALLDLAASTGRTVMLTSDHGHVVERGSVRREAAGADARFRPVAGGTGGAGGQTRSAGGKTQGAGGLAVQPDEVLLTGHRVLAGGVAVSHGAASAGGNSRSGGGAGVGGAAVGADRSAGGAIIAAVSEDLRYGNKAAGYHGGASAAEVTVPLVVLSQTVDALTTTGWQPAPPQAPPWWFAALPAEYSGSSRNYSAARSYPTALTDSSGPTDSSGRVDTSSRTHAGAKAGAGGQDDAVRQASAGQSTGSGSTTPTAHSAANRDGAAESSGSRAPAGTRDTAPPADHEQGALFTNEPPLVTAPRPTVGQRVAEELLASATYAAQRQSKERLSITDEHVAAVVACLVDRNGRAHRDIVAQAARMSSQRMRLAMSQFARLLNVEGFPVIKVDADGSTVVLYLRTLREQFGLRP